MKKVFEKNRRPKSYEKLEQKEFSGVFRRNQPQKNDDNDEYSISPRAKQESGGKPLNYFPSKYGRFIVLDTETTGLDVTKSHLVSINAVEVINKELTGVQFHSYIHPRHKKDDPLPNRAFTYYIEDYANERNSNAKNSLRDFLRFVNNSPIITHNAPFDIKFINKELKSYNLPLINIEDCICTLQIAKMKKIKGEIDRRANITVESLCKLYNIYVSEKDLHHGIVDAVVLGRIVCKMWEDKRYLKFEEDEYLPPSSSKKLKDYRSSENNFENYVQNHEDSYSVFEKNRIQELNNVPLRDCTNKYLNQANNVNRPIKGNYFKSQRENSNEKANNYSQSSTGEKTQRKLINCPKDIPNKYDNFEIKKCITDQLNNTIEISSKAYQYQKSSKIKEQKFIGETEKNKIVNPKLNLDYSFQNNRNKENKWNKKEESKDSKKGVWEGRLRKTKKVNYRESSGSQEHSNEPEFFPQNKMTPVKNNANFKENNYENDSPKNLGKMKNCLKNLLFNKMNS